jgi:hypothetical protein
MKPGELALAEAVRQLGVKEDPPASNRQPFGVWFGSDGKPWCAMFASWCFHAAGVELCDDYAGAGVRKGRGCAWVPSIAWWLRHRGWWLETSATPQPGDLVLYNWDGGEVDHVGIVESAPGPKRLVAIEGNVQGAVKRMKRDTAHVAGYGRIGG